MMSSAT